MTDEEKLAEKIICSKCSDDINRNYIHCHACHRCDDFIKGLAEGRKEKCLEQNKDGTIRPCEVMKENAELKAQIEKMKCCGNCKKKCKKIPEIKKCLDSNRSEWEMEE